MSFIISFVTVSAMSIPPFPFWMEQPDGVLTDNSVAALK
jgi:hypothetical protein